MQKPSENENCSHILDNFRIIQRALPKLIVFCVVMLELNFDTSISKALSLSTQIYYQSSPTIEKPEILSFPQASYLISPIVTKHQEPISKSSLDLTLSSIAAQSLTPTPKQSSTPTPTPTPKMKEFNGIIKSEMGKTLGSFLGLLLAAIFILLLGILVIILTRIFRFCYSNPTEIRIQPENDSSYPLYFFEKDLVSNFYKVLLELINCPNYLSEKLSFAEIQLKNFGLYKVIPLKDSNFGQVNLKFSIGPVEIRGFERLWNWLIGKRTYFVFISAHKELNDPDLTKLYFALVSKGTVLENIPVEITNIDKEIAWLDIVCKIIGRISSQIYKKNPKIEWKTSAAENMLHGIYLFVKYLQLIPKDVRILREAEKYFHNIKVSEGEWAFQAGLLEAIALQQTQCRPSDTPEKLHTLLEAYKGDKNRYQIITYNLGLAHFFTYSTDGYNEAIKYFEEIKIPNGHWIWRFWMNSRKMQFRLYYLAQANIAITKAHQLGNETDVKKQADLTSVLTNDINALRKNCMQNRQILDAAMAEVEWRLLNAESMVALNSKLNLETGIKAAREAIEIAPFALAVKANLGSLLLLKTAENKNPTQTSEFQESELIFSELFATGWDPGFVNYRLGIINRIKSEFENAKTFFMTADDPDIRDVDHQKIRYQLELSDKADSSLKENDF